MIWSKFIQPRLISLACTSKPIRKQREKVVPEWRSDSGFEVGVGANVLKDRVKTTAKIEICEGGPKRNYVLKKHVKERGLCKIVSTAGAQNGAKRYPDVDSVAKDRSGAGDNGCAEMSRTGKCVDCLWAHGRQSGKTCDTWAKEKSRAGSCNHFKISKTEKCVHCL